MSRAGLTPLEAALGFVLRNDAVDVGLVGVTSPRELEEILRAASRAPMPALDWRRFALTDPVVLTPSLW